MALLLAPLLSRALAARPQTKAKAEEIIGRRLLLLRKSGNRSAASARLCDPIGRLKAAPAEEWRTGRGEIMQSCRPLQTSFMSFLRRNCCAAFIAPAKWKPLLRARPMTQRAPATWKHTFAPFHRLAAGLPLIDCQLTSLIETRRADGNWS